MESSCDLYLAPSVIPDAGRGIIAGKHYNGGEIIEEAATLVIPVYITSECQLNNYVFSTESDEYAMVIFGPGSLYNHQYDQSIQHYWLDYDVKDVTAMTTSPYSDYTGNYFETLREIKYGEEIFEYYGDDWFQRFDSEEDSSSSNTNTDQVSEGSRNSDRQDTLDTDATEDISERYDISGHTVADSFVYPDASNVLSEVGHCLSDVAVGDSTIPDAGRGLFAQRRFEAGEVVTISPVLTLPKDVVDASYYDSLLINYCMGASVSDVVIFPLNYAPMINHNDMPNVRLDWYEWPTVTSSNHSDIAGDSPSIHQLHSKLSLPPQEIFQYSFAPLDLVYIAIEPIEAGDEIFVDYGPHWEEAWESYQYELTEAAIRQHNTRVREQVTLERAVLDSCSEDCSAEFASQYYSEVVEVHENSELVSEECQACIDEVRSIVIANEHARKAAAKGHNRRHRRRDHRLSDEMENIEVDESGDIVDIDSAVYYAGYNEIENDYYEDDYIGEEVVLFRQYMGVPVDLFPDHWIHEDYRNSNAEDI